MTEESLNPLAVELEEFKRRYVDPWLEHMRPKWERAANEYDERIAKIINERSKA